MRRIRVGDLADPSVVAVPVASDPEPEHASTMPETTDSGGPIFGSTGDEPTGVDTPSSDRIDLINKPRSVGSSAPRLRSSAAPFLAFPQAARQTLHASCN